MITKTTQILIFIILGSLQTIHSQTLNNQSSNQNLIKRLDNLEREVEILKLKNEIEHVNFNIASFTLQISSAEQQLSKYLLHNLFDNDIYQHYSGEYLESIYDNEKALYINCEALKNYYREISENYNLTETERMVLDADLGTMNSALENIGSTIKLFLTTINGYKNFGKFD